MPRKAISEVVATLLLIAITIAGAIIVYVYSSGMLGSLQGAQPQQPYTNQIALEYYDWTSPGTLKLVLRNVGTGRGTLADFFISNSTFSTAVSLAGGNCTTFSGTTTTTAAITTLATTTLKTTAILKPLYPQTFCTAILNVSVDVTPHAAYVVKIITRDGSVFTYSCIAGRSSGTFS